MKIHRSTYQRSKVYAGLDVGSNKPSQSERSKVPHHLLDVVEPCEERFTAGRFVEECCAAVDEVAARGKVPIVCGGTPLYLQVITKGCGGGTSMLGDFF